MAFFAAVLLTWAFSYLLGLSELDRLPTFLPWGIWTIVVCTPGVLAWYEDWVPLVNKLFGMAGFTLLLLCFVLRQDAAILLLPTDALNPDLWPTLYALLNMVVPFGLAATGMARIAILRE